MKSNSIPLIVFSVLTACASKPPPESPASTAHSDTAPKTSIEAEQAAAEQSAAFVTEIQFKKDSADLTPAAKTNLGKMLGEAGKTGKPFDIKTIAWADAEYPSPNKKELSKKDESLAANRNKSIQQFIQTQKNQVKVEAYNMTERPGVFQNWLSTSDARIKESLEKAGVPNTDTSVKIPSKAGKAIVMAILKK